uniref:Uncharacterized protein n=1 Tax=Mycena chlorophos TaxID=658473 RepID=A0ABQ0LJP3_MYCCL|nr:predicted protein [Mycena chlorophos]
MSGHREVLEMEDDDARLHRIQTALEKLNAATLSGPNPPRADIASALGSSRTLELGSGTHEGLQDLLARVQAFLPQMEASNAAIAEQAALDPHSVDIENVEEDQEVVEMHLGLGVFEDRTGREGERSESDSEEDSSSDDSESTSEDSSGSSDSDSESSVDVRLRTRPIRPLPKRARGPPEIVVLSETTTS